MRGLDVLGARPTPSRGPRAAPHPHAKPSAKPQASTGPSARSVASAHKAQAAASRAIAAGQRLSKHNKSAGKRLIAAGNAHNARAQKLLKGSGRRGGAVMGVVQGPDPGDAVDPQTASVNAVAQLGEMVTQMLDWVTTLQQNGPQAAWKQVVQAQRSAM